MKINGEIELSGITEVVYNKKYIWKRHTVDNKYVWICGYIDCKNEILTNTLSQDEMINIIKDEIEYNSTRVWVSGNTVNIG